MVDRLDTVSFDPENAPPTLGPHSVLLIEEQVPKATQVKMLHGPRWIQTVEAL